MGCLASWLLALAEVGWFCHPLRPDVKANNMVVQLVLHRYGHPVCCCVWSTVVSQLWQGQLIVPFL